MLVAWRILHEARAFYIVDRGFLDFEQLIRFHETGSEHKHQPTLARLL